MVSAKDSNEQAKERLAEMREATVKGLWNSFSNHVPRCPYRDFGLWALGAEEPNEKFLQIFGVNQLANMTSLLLQPVAQAPEIWSGLLGYAAAINAWLTHEVISDNLAIGLGLPESNDDSQKRLRREIIYNFNRQMQEGLADTDPSCDRFARELSKYDGKESLFSHMLAPEKYISLAEIYAQDHDTRLQDIEGCISAALAANIMSCANAINAIKTPKLRALVRDWTSSRYASVSALMQSDALDTDSLIHHGTLTILVAPTLGFYCAALSETRREANRLSESSVFDLLKQCLLGAATLVRLLNDLGTPILTCSKPDRIVLLASMCTQLSHASKTGMTIGEALSQFRSESFTRLTKDTVHQEINMCLHGLAHVLCTEQTINELSNRINTCADMYTREFNRMTDSLNALTSALGTHDYSVIISRFVEFHKKLYQKHYDSEEGEYAI